MKRILLLLTVVIAAMQVMGADVDLANARATAQQFVFSKMSTSGKLTSPAAVDVKLIKQEMNNEKAGAAVYYIFNTDEHFIVIAGDDRAQQVLAYGDRPLDLSRMPSNMKFWLNTYKTQIAYLQAHPTLAVERPAPGRSLKAAPVGPLLTAEWDQSMPYYNQCPSYNGSPCLTGCPATSLSMVFYYWKYPTEPTPAVEGYTNNSYGFEIPALPSITFDWENMLDTYSYGTYTSTQANAVAWLMRYVGQEEHMDYSPSGSGAFGEDILRAVKFFGYDEDAQLLFKSVADDDGNEIEVYYSDDEWATLLQNEMYEGRPVVYCAYDYSSWNGWSGHAFNVDGYTPSSNTYHVNWGWSGDGNGDFALNAFSSSGYTFNVEQQMVLGIQPPALGPAIKANPTKLDMAGFVDQTTTATFTVKGQELNDDITMTLNDEHACFSIDADHVAVSEQEGGKVVTVNYAPQTVGNHTASITLSSPGAEDVTVIINGTAALQTFVPVMQPADSAYINLTQFRADWTDQTADKFVNSYTLEVSPRSFVEQLDSLDGSLYPDSYETMIFSAPWGGYSVNAGYDAIYISNGYYSGSGYITYTIPQGYDNEVFSLQITTTNSSYGKGNITVKSNQTAAVGHQFASGETFTWTVVGSTGEKITITTSESSYSPDMSKIKVYAGDANSLAPDGDSSDDSNYRLIQGINGKSYLVENLAAGGTYYYRVKGLYTDGTESKWSKSQCVTLFENGHGFQAGDVNHDGLINITDVTLLISYVRNENDDTICKICADINGDNSVNISDITLLISRVLNSL